MINNYIKMIQRVAQNNARIERRKLAPCKTQHRDSHHQVPVIRRTFLATGFPDVARTVGVRFCIERLRRRRGRKSGGKSMTAMTMRVRACVRQCARQAREGKDRRKVGRGTMSARASAKRRGDGGAAACAHRRALHSACTSERCG